jgi:peptidyl-tRNA hydrolase
VKEQMEPTDTFVLRRFTAEEQEALQHSIFPQAEALLRTLLGGSKSERHIARRIIL